MEAKSVAAMVREFHEVFDCAIGDSPRLTGPTTNQLRLDLIDEERIELGEGLEASDVVAVADALGDLVYVIYGAALTWGIDLDRAVTAIHASNLTKLGADGRPVLRADGKVLKGPHYEAPDLSWLRTAGLGE